MLLTAQYLYNDNTKEPRQGSRCQNDDDKSQALYVSEQSVFLRNSKKGVKVWLRNVPNLVREPMAT